MGRDIPPVREIRLERRRRYRIASVFPSLVSSPENESAWVGSVGDLVDRIEIE